MNLVPMMLAVAAFVMVGRISGSAPASRPLLSGIFLIIFVMAMTRGFYWNIFGRGHGFFTLNRTSAIVVFLIATVIGVIWGLKRPLPERQ